MRGVGAHIHPPPGVVDDHLVEIAVRGPAQRAVLLPGARIERMVLEIQAHRLRVGRDGVDPLLAPGAEQLQRRAAGKLRVVEFRDRRWVHHIAPLDLHRIGIGGGDMAVAGDVLVELHMHQPVFFQGVHLPGLGLARLEEPQRLRDRHLIDQDLVPGQRLLGDPVPGLDDGRLPGFLGRRHPGGQLEELADRHRIGGVVRPLVDHLEPVRRHQAGRRHLHPAGAPAKRHRHLARGERHLIPGHRHRLQKRAANHPLGLLVEIGEVVGTGHKANPLSLRSRRRVSGSVNRTPSIPSAFAASTLHGTSSMKMQSRGARPLRSRQTR